MRIFLKEALVKSVQGDVVVMVELKIFTPAGKRISSLTFLALDEIMVLVLLFLNSLPFIYSLHFGTTVKCS